MKATVAMKHLKLFESDDDLGNMLDDLDAIGGKANLTRRLYGWYIQYTYGDGYTTRTEHAIIKAPSEEAAVKKVWEGIFYIETDGDVKPPKSFDDFDKEFHDTFAKFSDYTAPDIRWFEMTPRNRSLDNAGGYELIPNPYAITAALDKEFTDAKAVLATKLK